MVKKLKITKREKKKIIDWFLFIPLILIAVGLIGMINYFLKIFFPITELVSNFIIFGVGIVLVLILYYIFDVR